MPALLLVMLGASGGLWHGLTAREAPRGAETPAAPGKPFIHRLSPAVAARTGAARSRAGTEESRALRSRLAGFVIPEPGIRRLPPGDALAMLRHYWETLPHAPGDSGTGSFLLTSAAEDWLRTARQPLTVTLEIPAVSLLTNLRLLAAQTGLAVHIGPEEVHLIPDRTVPLADDSLHTATLPAASWFSRTPGSSRRLLFGGGHFPGPDSGNAEPELTGFEGFISYGTSIETTGLSAPEAMEPVILMLPPGPYGSRILGSLGVPAAPAPAPSAESSAVPAHFWDEAAARLTITAPARLQRAAAVALEAMQERTSAAIRLEAWPWQWISGERPPAPPPEGRKGIPRETFRLPASGTVRIPPFPGSLLLPTPENLLACDVTARAVGASWEVEISLPPVQPALLQPGPTRISGPDWASPGGEMAAAAGTHRTVTLFPRLWHRLDLPGLRGAPVQCLHLRARSAPPPSP